MSNKLTVLAAWGSLAFMTFATLSPIGLRPHFASVEIEHMVAFAVAGLLFGSAYPRHITLVIALIFGSAVLLELLQLVTPDRHARLLDLGQKLLGGSIGIAVAWIFQRSKKVKFVVPVIVLITAGLVHVSDVAAPRAETARPL